MHFTYTAAEKSQLLQGDVICRTKDMEGLLKEVHPHYFEKPDYRYFIILTQSCDLVRRNDQQCRSRYISLAAVRPLRLVIERELERYQYDEIERRLKFCEISRKAKLEQFLERLLNNNEPSYFFLYREPNLGMEEDHCAFLHLSIAVKADLHYNTLLGAKILQLTESFQHKLGHLVGSMYSRVGTEDWVPMYATEEKFREHVQRPIDNPDLVLWLERDIHKRVLRELKNLPPDQQTEDVLKTFVEKAIQTRQAHREEILDIICKVLTDLEVESEVVEKARGRLQNQSDFRARIK